MWPRKSVNFEFLRPRWGDLAALGGFAEQYAHPDPQSALVKLRLFAERMVDGIYQRLGLPKLPQAHLIDLLNNDVFRAVTPAVVLDKLHAVRIHGNKAAHGETISRNTALWLLRECHDLGRWFFVAYMDGDQADCPSYQEPPAGGLAGATKAKLKQEKKAALGKLARQEAQLESLLTELEAARAALATTQAQVDQQTAAATARQAADVLQFDEATTRRRLIDSQLVLYGWRAGENGTDTEEVRQEYPVAHQPTATGQGYADYVLWDDNGKPLAVIEAKKTALDAEQGRTQARLYADGLERDHGQRPVIFYTNGFDIWLWDDAQGYPPRQLFGLYSKDSLQYLIYQRRATQALDSVPINPDIVDRLYQFEAIKRITERFTARRRKALNVQATGTGKTRVAIALTDVLNRAGWVKRVLFLCDRRELRKQAKNSFNDFLNEPLVVVNARTARDRNQRIYLATYPAMLKVFQTFDVGFFDLLIADESHRSIYNVYGDLFRYFDCLQVGLTATPVEFVSRNTYRLFDCENQLPTFHYDFARAVQEGYVVPFEVRTFTTDFLRRGIKYTQLSEEQRRELEEGGEDPRLFDYEVRDVDANVYNKDTSRHVLRNLMENGILDGSGQLGKSIIFARNHEHAVQLRKVFDELYPQYGGQFCQVIDNYDPRAEQLIDDFKQRDHPLTIAISVDMLDTGIDVPEVVNLVFAKPVYSKVKFWQMIGRGSRLCPDLFGPGRDKPCFRIFDHWGNFDFFDFHYQPVEPVTPKSLMQRLFEARIELAEMALRATEPAVFESTVQLLEADLKSLPADSIAVREKWRVLRSVSQPGVLAAWAPATVAALRGEIAPLLQWVNIRGHVEAHELDLLMTQLQIERLRQSGRFDDYRIDLLDRVNNLRMHLNPVREKAELIKQIRSPRFWREVTAAQLESVRQELRTIIHHQQKPGRGAVTGPKVIDVSDGDIRAATRTSSVPVVDLKVYRKQVEDALVQLFERDPILRKIRRGEPVSPAELTSLTALVLTQNPDVRLDVLAQFFDAALPLDFILRSIVGMEPEAVKARFAAFVRRHPGLNAKQTRFLSLLQNHLARHGAIEIERLYDSPFTRVDADGIDGVFGDEQADELIALLDTFGPNPAQEAPTP